MVTNYGSKVIIEHFICISGPMNSILVSWNKKRRIENKNFKLFTLRALDPQIRGTLGGKRISHIAGRKAKWYHNLKNSLGVSIKNNVLTKSWTNCFTWHLYKIIQNFSPHKIWTEMLYYGIHKCPNMEATRVFLRK